MIAEQLKNNIRCGKILEGECLPTQNELITKHNVALGTARRVIDQLVSEGWARTEKRRGIFAQKPVDVDEGLSAMDSLGFAVMGNISHYDPVEQMVLKGFSSVLQAAEKKVNYSVFPMDDKFEIRFNQFLNGVSGVIVNEYFNKDVLLLLKKRRMKAVLVGYSYTYDPLIEEFHCVAPNIFMVGYSAGKLMGEMHHRKIAFVYPSESVYFTRLREGIFQACQDYGAECIEPIVAPPYEAEIEAAKKLAAMPDVTGAIISGDLNACRIIQQMEKLGLKIPEDKSVLAIGGISREILSHPYLSRIDVNLQMMGQEAAKQLLEDTEIIVHKKIPAFYDQGKTLSFPKSQSSSQSE
jgi:DNA-binding LacI/PurR family transcriptional regulator